MTPRRLVHVTTTDMSLALLLGPQLRAYRDAGYEVLAMSAPGPYVAGLEADGITHVPLRHATRAMAPAADARLLVELEQSLRRLRPAIVHTHNPKPGVYGRLAARAARVPAIVHTTHGLYAQPTDPRRRRVPLYALERIAALCSHAELVQNPEDLETLAAIGVPRRKLRLLGNGVDLTRFDPATVDPGARAAVRAELGAGDADVVVGTVARLVWEKGYRELFDAAGRLRTEAPSVRIVAVGGEEPEKGDGLDPAAKAAARADGVTFLGHREDVTALYSAFDVFVLASHREGFPRSAMEAAAMGVPLVATDIRGCREVVDHEENGLLVPVRDGASLAAAIARLADDPFLRQRFGAAGRAKAEREFDDRRVIDITLSTYASLHG